jgi:hypothetical protein
LIQTSSGLAIFSAPPLNSDGRLQEAFINAAERAVAQSSAQECGDDEQDAAGGFKSQELD